MVQSFSATWCFLSQKTIFLTCLSVAGRTKSSIHIPVLTDKKMNVQQQETIEKTIFWRGEYVFVKTYSNDESRKAS